MPFSRHIGWLLWLYVYTWYFVLSLTMLTTILDKGSLYKSASDAWWLIWTGSHRKQVPVLSAAHVYWHTRCDSVMVSCRIIIMKCTQNSTHNLNNFFWFCRVCLYVRLFHTILMYTKISTTWFCYFLPRKSWRNFKERERGRERKGKKTIQTNLKCSTRKHLIDQMKMWH